MTRHTALYSLITGLDLTALGIASSSQVYRTAAPSSPEQYPFIVIKWDSSSPLVGTVSSERVEVWAYSEDSYVPIEDILRAVRDAMLDAPDVLGGVTWSGYSRDLYDDIYKCLTKYAAFTLPAGGG